MKKHSETKLVPLGVLALAVSGNVLRRGYYTYGAEAGGLLVRSHPMVIAMWLCVAAAVGLIAYGALREGSRSRFEEVFGASRLSGLGHILAGLFLLKEAWLGTPHFVYRELLEQLWIIAGASSGLLLIWAGADRFRGKRPFYGTYAVCSVFFAIHLVFHYQDWCAQPQMIHYVFDFFGAVFAMLSAYQLAALCVGRGDSRLQRVFGLLALLFCVGTLVVTQNPLIYVGSTIWAASCVSSPVPSGKNREECCDEPS